MTEFTSDQRRQLTDAGLMMLRAIGNVYGSDRALDMWNTIADTVDPALKLWTFEAMLLGRQECTLVITALPQFCDKIAVIKAIRSWDRRQPGLKEAKDMMEALAERGQEITLEVNYQRIDSAAADFRRLGCRGIGI